MSRILFVFIFAAQSLFSAGFDSKYRCVIHITYHTYQNEVYSSGYEAKVQSETQCFQRKKLHEINFSPQEVKTKEVEAKWEKIP